MHYRERKTRHLTCFLYLVDLPKIYYDIYPIFLQYYTILLDIVFFVRYTMSIF